MSFFINGGGNMAKRKMEFDFSVFGCNAKAAREAFEAAGYEVTYPKPKQVFKDGQRVKILPGARPHAGEYAIIKAQTLGSVTVWVNYFTEKPGMYVFHKNEIESATDHPMCFEDF